MSNGDVRNTAQQWAVIALIQHFRVHKKARAAVLHCAVRVGKTKISLDFADRWAGNQNILIVAPSTEIVDQWVESVTKFHNGRWTVGVVDGSRKEFGRDITVTTIDSGTNYINAFLDHGPYALLIFDECHRALSNSGKNIIDTFMERTTGRALLVTATMGRSDGQLLSRWSSGVAISIDHEQSVRFGMNVNIRTHYVESNDVASVFNEWKAIAGYTPTIIFTPTKAEAALWAKYWNQNGIVAETINGDMGKNKRNAILGRYRTGETLVLTNAGVLGEGVDANRTQCVILAERPLTNTPEYQRIGRSLGAYDLKDSAIAIFCGTKRRDKGVAVTKPGYVGDRNAETRNRLNRVGQWWYDVLTRLIER